MSQISRVTSGNKYIEKAEEIASRSSPLRLLNSNSEDIYTQILYLLSVEKASVPDSAANAASTTSSSTPRESRPITTLFLLTAVFSVPSFHHCVTVHYHHHPTERHHHRCQPFGAFYDDSFFLFPPLSLSLSSPTSVSSSSHNGYRSTITITTTRAVVPNGRWSLVQLRKATMRSRASTTSVFVKSSTTRCFPLVYVNLPLPQFSRPVTFSYREILRDLKAHGTKRRD